MRKLVFHTIIIFFLFLSMSSIAIANDASQALVAQGRAALFDNGSWTYSGIIEANSYFQQAVNEDADDQEANFFYAITRVLAFALEQGTGSGLETFRDVLEAFGFTRNNNDSIEDSPYADPTQILARYVPPENAPNGEDLRVFLANEPVPLLDSAITNLNSLSEEFTTTISSAETGDTEVEVDYGDILLIKAAYYALKGTLLLSLIHI